MVFSQWVRTHELIIRRLKERGWDYALFHGGVPGEKRGALVERFVEDPACRVFLSTDAGGVGLNLQHAAATVVNMDMPWNPAVLEQRIGRVHRMGQTRSVQVVNFVAQGTIEEGMLSVLAFKKSLFAGVLDGGENEVFLHGTRLSAFMKSVDEVTGAMGAAEPLDAAAAADAESEAARPAQAAETVAADAVAADAASAQDALLSGAEGGGFAPPVPDPWAILIDAGLKLVETLAAARGEGGTESAARAAPQSWIETDAATGKSYLKLPVPEPATVQRLADALSGLLAGLRQ